MCFETFLKDDVAITLFLKKCFQIAYKSWLSGNTRNMKLTDAIFKKTST